MAKWYNEKANEDIIKKIDEVKLDVSAYAKSAIDDQLFAIDKAQNDKLDEISKSIGFINQEFSRKISAHEIKIGDSVSGFALCSRELDQIKNEDLERIYEGLIVLHQKNNNLSLLVGFLTITLFGVVLWILVNL